MFKSFKRVVEHVPFWGYNLFLFLAFISISLFYAPYHEIWADEAQAFLIARDADWEKILTDISSQEGQPILWHIVLKLFIGIFGASLNITYVSIFFMSLTVGIFLFCYHTPQIYKILIPFGYYFLYQYNIVSRNYCLSYLALAMLGLWYPQRHVYIKRYVGCLLLLAQSSSFYAPISALLAFFWMAESFKHKNNIKQHLIAFSFLVLCGLVMLWQILPINHIETDLRKIFTDNYPYNTIAHFFEVFFIGSNLGLNIIFLTFLGFIAIKAVMSPDLYKRFKENRVNVIYFSAVWIAFIAIYFVVRPIFYHQGLILGLFLTTIYMFFPTYCQRKNHFFFIACLIMQIYWSYTAIRYDINHASAVRTQLSALLKFHQRDNDKIQTIGYHTLPFRSITDKSKLYVSPRNATYWFWSEESIPGNKYTQMFIDAHHDVMAISETNVKYVDLSYYENEDKFYQYKIPAALAYKGYIFYQQGVRLYIRKD